MPVVGLVGLEVQWDQVSSTLSSKYQTTSPRPTFSIANICRNFLNFPGPEFGLEYSRIFCPVPIWLLPAFPSSLAQHSFGKVML